MLNGFLVEPALQCRKHLFHRKWVIAPSLRVGNQWLDTLARNGNSILNATIKTIKGAAVETAIGEIANSGRAVISNTALMVLTDVILQKLRQKSTRYLGALPHTENLVQVTAHTISALRSAGVSPDAITPEHFESPDKAADFRFIMEEYTAMLKTHSWADYADALKIATEKVLSDPGALPKDVILFVPENLEMNALEKKFLAAIPEEKRVSLSFRSKVAPDEMSDAQLLSRLNNPAGAPAPKLDETASIFRAFGEVNEVREVLRRLISGGISLDHVELLHTDFETYVPTIYETLARITKGANGDPAGLPVTFAEGIPARYSRPGRALIGFIQWIQSDFEQEILYRMLQDGLIRLPEDDHPVSYSRIARVFADIQIGYGLDRYLPAIQGAFNAVLEESEAEASEAPAEPHSEKHDIELLHDLLTRLVEACREIPETVIEPALKFLRDFARCASELDNYAKNALVESIEDFTEATRIMESRPEFDCLQWLLSLSKKTRVCGSGPRPGRIHVASLAQGGHTGRKHTFVIGLDDSRFPGASAGNPLLPDEESAKISDDLPKADSSRRRKLKDFEDLFLKIEGTITLGYSCHDLVEDGEKFPSLPVFSAYRILSGNPDGDQSSMTEWLPPPSSFAPLRADECLDSSEWWLFNAANFDKIKDPEPFIADAFPHLFQGMKAAKARESADFTPYDGRVSIGEEDNPFADVGPVISAERLEAVGKCPLNYFFRYILRLQPRPDLVIDPTQWLSPLDHGNLLHDLFYRFMGLMIKEGRLPIFHRDRASLMKLLEELIDSYKKKAPPPTAGSFQRSVDQLIRCADIFLIEEEELFRCGSFKPRNLELSIGMDPRNPVYLTLDSGAKIKACGRLDRLDEMGDPDSFGIWDYKTGSTTKYDTKDPFNQGRVVQHALHMRIASETLQKRLSKKAQVREFGYFFTQNKAKGARIIRRPDPTAGDFVIANLCEIISNGAFTATDNSLDCSFCDYALICGINGPPDKHAGRKSRGRDSGLLDPFINLRGGVE
jgi:ATP-dependent helicase/nuclease subunit B